VSSEPGDPVSSLITMCQHGRPKAFKSPSMVSHIVSFTWTTEMLFCSSVVGSAFVIVTDKGTRNASHAWMNDVSTYMPLLLHGLDR